MMFCSDFYFNICFSFLALTLLHFLPPIFIMDSDAWMVCTRWEKGKASWNSSKIPSLNCVDSIMGISEAIFSKRKEGSIIFLLEFLKFRGTAWTGWMLYCLLTNISEPNSSCFQKFSCQFMGKDSLIWLLQSANTAEVKHAEAALTLTKIC